MIEKMLYGHIHRVAIQFPHDFTVVCAVPDDYPDPLPAGLVRESDAAGMIASKEDYFLVVFTPLIPILPSPADAELLPSHTLKCPACKGAPVSRSGETGGAFGDGCKCGIARHDGLDKVDVDNIVGSKTPITGMVK